MMTQQPDPMRQATTKVIQIVCEDHGYLTEARKTELIEGETHWRITQNKNCTSTGNSESGEPVTLDGSLMGAISYWRTVFTCRSCPDNLPVKNEKLESIFETIHRANIQTVSLNGLRGIL